MSDTRSDREDRIRSAAMTLGRLEGRSLEVQETLTRQKNHARACIGGDEYKELLGLAGTMRTLQDRFRKLCDSLSIAEEDLKEAEKPEEKPRDFLAQVPEPKFKNSQHVLLDGVKSAVIQIILLYFPENPPNSMEHFGYMYTLIDDDEIFYGAYGEHRLSPVKGHNPDESCPKTISETDKEKP